MGGCIWFLVSGFRGEGRGGLDFYDGMRQRGGLMPAPLPRVLVADASLPNRRLIRELLTAFRSCEVDDAATGEHTFERALQRPYALFIFAMTLPDMSGALLDRLIAKMYPQVHAGSITAPPVVFLVRHDEGTAFRQVERDARVRGSVPLPLNLDLLMNTAGKVLPGK